MKQPFFSVIIPVYNVENFLEDSVRSVTSQDFTDYEVILVDDGSKDSSGQICDQLAQEDPSHIRVLHIENSGPLLARSRALKIAFGKYFMFLDSDDMYVDGIFKRMYDIIALHQADMVLFDFSLVYSKERCVRYTLGNEDNTVFSGTGINTLRRMYIESSSINSLCNKCIQRELFDLNFDYTAFTGLKQSEDRLMIAPLLDRAEKVVYVKESLYKYRMREGSTQHNFRLKNYKDVQVVNRFVEDYKKKWQLIDSLNVDTRSLSFAYNVLFSIAEIRDKKERYVSFWEAAAYIAEDENFISAVNSVGIRKFSKNRQTALKLLSKNYLRAAYAYFRLAILLNKVKRKG